MLTKQVWRRRVRVWFEELSGDQQERALARARLPAVMLWQKLTMVELDRLYGAIRAVALIDET